MKRAKLSLLLLILAAGALLAGCREDPKPDPARKPDAPVGDTQLRDTIHKPIDRAKSVEGIIMKSKDNQDQQLQDAEGAQASPSSQ